MNLNAIPILGWLLDFLLSASLAVPFWFAWTYFGLGAKFFYFLPVVYHSPSFLECVGLIIAVDIIKSIIFPKLNVSNEFNKENK